MAYRAQPNPDGGPPIVSFDTPLDFVEYIDSLPKELQDPGSLRQAEEIRANPSAWEMSGGHPKRRDDWLARNLPWLGPAAIGAIVGAPYLPGLFGGGSAVAGGASASAAGPPTAASFGTTWPALEAAAAGTAPAGIAARVGGPSVGRRLANTAAGAASQFNPWQQAALAALAGLPGLLANRGPSDEEKALLAQAKQLQALQQRRIEYQNPLFQAVSQLAMSRLPTAQQRPMGDL